MTVGQNNAASPRRIKRKATDQCPASSPLELAASGKRMGVGNALLCLAGIFLLALTLKNAALASTLALEGLKLCAVVIVPSLFPFMVISEFFANSPIASLLGKIFQRPAKLLFGVSGEGACAVILGAFCGFPVGARLAISAYENGRASKEETERLLAFSGIPSAAFLIGAAGSSLFSSKEIGVKLFISVLSASLLSGILLNLIHKTKPKNFRDTPPLYSKYSNNSANTTHSSATKLFVSSVSSSAESVLKVCAFIVFFNVLSGCLSNLLSSLSCSPIITTILFGTLELTGGVTHSAALASVETGAIFAALCCGWSGFSVHCQLASFCAGHDLSLRTYLRSKLLQAPLSAIFMYLLIRFC